MIAVGYQVSFCEQVVTIAMHHLFQPCPGPQRRLYVPEQRAYTSPIMTLMLLNALFLDTMTVKKSRLSDPGVRSMAIPR